MNKLISIKLEVLLPPISLLARGRPVDSSHKFTVRKASTSNIILNSRTLWKDPFENLELSNGQLAYGFLRYQTRGLLRTARLLTLVALHLFQKEEADCERDEADVHGPQVASKEERALGGGGLERVVESVQLTSELLLAVLPLRIGLGQQQLEERRNELHKTGLFYWCPYWKRLPPEMSRRYDSSES
jgi:hypothetical protein